MSREFHTLANVHWQLGEPVVYMGKFQLGDTLTVISRIDPAPKRQFYVQYSASERNHAWEDADRMLKKCPLEWVQKKLALKEAIGQSIFRL